MGKKKSKSIKTNLLVIVLLGAFILGISALALIFILQHVYGRFTAEEILPTKQNLVKALSTQNNTIALLHSRYTEKMFPDSSVWITENVSTWKRFIENAGFRCDVIYDHDIEKGKHFGYPMVALPSAKAMSTIQIIQLKRYIENGGSVLATSSIGAFNEQGDWRGWKFLIEIFGLQFIQELPPANIIRSQKLKGGLPVTSDIPAGHTIRVATWNQPIVCKVVEDRTTQVSYWTSAANDGTSLGSDVSEAAGIVFGTYGKGKFVWMGFELDAVKGKQYDYIYLEKFFKNSIDWLNHVPTIFVKDWPSPYAAAAIITPFLNGDISNIRNIYKIVRKDSIPVTFFIDPVSASKNRDLLHELVKYGNIGAISDLGSLTPEKDQPILMYDYESQVVNLKKAKRIIQPLIDQDVIGAMPFYGGFDQSSIHALISAGYKYIISDSSANRVIPNHQIKGKGLVISLHRTVRDDYDVIQRYEFSDTKFQLATYIDDVNSIHFLGGLYIWRIHPEYQCQPDNVQVLKELVHYIREKNIWLTTPAEIRDWWASKNALEIHAEIRSIRRIILEISNAGNVDIHDCVIQVEFNKRVENVRISSEIIGTRIPDYLLEPDKQQLYINLINLKAKETLSLFIDFDNVRL